MSDRKPAWFDDEQFWETMAPYRFGERRLAVTESDVDGVLGLADFAPGAAVLDLCCGPGRHSAELARRGFAVTGVDRTAPYLELARERAAEIGVKLDLELGDMRRFCRPSAFDGAINLFTSFGFFPEAAENFRVLENLYRSLKPGGVLVMDMMGKEVLAGKFREREWSEHDGVLFLEERRPSEGWKRIETRWILVTGARRREFFFSLRLYSAGELISLLTRAGFAEVDVFGSLQGVPYDHEATRLVARARKAL